MPNVNTTTVAANARANKHNVMLALILEGVDGVSRLHKATGFSRSVAESAVEDLVNAGKSEEAGILAGWTDDAFGPKGDGTRGRKPATYGETRTYLVQQVDGSSPFIRLPVDLLGAAKGGTVKVKFDRDGITVTV